jgi:hypothetical protein
MDNTTSNPLRVRAGHYAGARLKAWCVLIHAEASLSLSAVLMTYAVVR